MTTVIRTSVFYSHIRTKHPQILSAYPLFTRCHIRRSAHPLITHSQLIHIWTS